VYLRAGSDVFLDDSVPADFLSACICIADMGMDPVAFTKHIQAANGKAEIPVGQKQGQTEISAL